MDEPQQIVSTRKLYCLQSHDLNTSSMLATIKPSKKCTIIYQVFDSQVLVNKTTQYQTFFSTLLCIYENLFVWHTNSKLSACLVVILTWEAFSHYQPSAGFPLLAIQPSGFPEEMIKRFLSY